MNMAKKKAAKAPSLDYQTTLTIGDMVYKGEGATAHEALASLPSDIKMTYKAVLSMTKGAKTYSTMFYTQILRRFINNPLTRVIWAKRFEQQLA